MVVISSSERYTARNGSRLPPPPPPPPRNGPSSSSSAAGHGHHESQSSKQQKRSKSSESLADHIAVLQAELDAAVREAQRSDGRHQPPPPPAPPASKPSSSECPPRRGRRHYMDRPPAVVHASNSSLGKSLSSSSMADLEVDSLSRSSSSSGGGSGLHRRAGGRRGFKSRSYDYDELSRGSSNASSLGSGGGGGRKHPQQPQSNSTVLMLNFVIAVLAAVLGAAGGYIMSHARHGDLVLDTYRTLERLQQMQQHHHHGRGGAAQHVDEPQQQQQRQMQQQQQQQQQGLGKPKARTLAESRKEKQQQVPKAVEKQQVPKAVEVEVENEEVREKKAAEADAQLNSYLWKMEYKNALERYGEGPHRVMFTLEVPYSYYPDVKPSGLHGTGVRKRVYLETVPLDMMPHSVRSFLDIIDAGLYNGVRLNVVTRDGNPAIDFDNRDVPAAKDEHVASRFFNVEDDNNAAVATMEYDERHADVVHGKGTVGFLGRGPGMVFNVAGTEENGHHGCFARVVEGLDVLEHINAVRGGTGALSEPITIRVARMMRPHEMRTR